MVTKEDITTQKMEHPAIFMTWGDFFSLHFRYIFYNYPTIFPKKSFDEKPVRAKM